MKGAIVQTTEAARIPLLLPALGAVLFLTLAAFGADLLARPATSTPQGQPGPAVPARLNTLIPRLQQGRPIFGGTIPVGSAGRAKQASGSGWDFVLMEMGYSGLELELTMQFLLDRRQILEHGTLAPPVVPLVRLPSNGRETNQWLIKHSLDQGAYGIVVPHTNTVEEAETAIVFSRYAQAAGAPDSEPAGHRGVAPGNAQRWWGIRDYREYHRRADVWPLDPDGELMVWIMIAEEEGVRNLADLLRRVKVSAVIADEVDLAMSMGLAERPSSPQVDAELKKIVEVCKQFKVPVGAPATRDNVEQRVRDGYQILITDDPVAIERGRKAAR